MDPNARAWNPYGGQPDPRYPSSRGTAAPPARGSGGGGMPVGYDPSSRGYYSMADGGMAGAGGGYVDPYLQQQRMLQYQHQQQLIAAQQMAARAAAAGSGAAGMYGGGRREYDPRSHRGAAMVYDGGHDSYDRSYGSESYDYPGSTGGRGSGGGGGSGVSGEFRPSYHSSDRRVETRDYTRDTYETSEPTRPVRIAKPGDFDDDSEDEAATKAKASASAGGGGGGGGGRKRKRKRGRGKGKKTTEPTESEPKAPVLVAAAAAVESERTTEEVSVKSSQPESAEIIELTADVDEMKVREEPVIVSKPAKAKSSGKKSSPPKSAAPSKSGGKSTSSATTVSDEQKTVDPSPAATPKKKKKGRTRTHDPHDPREHLNLVLIGHVDAGKSTISGQILLLTGQIDERIIEKYEREAKERGRESWWIAYIMDEDDEERAKGKTVECGRAHFDTERKRYTILDAPGHKNYVPNMISGASQADVAILVVSARKGEFEAGFDRGGQTREHSLLAWTLGINRIIIAVNKIDACEFSEERYTQIVTDITDHLKEIGFNEKYIYSLPISGQEGLNIKSRFPDGLCPWWKGNSLIETLDEMKALKRKTKKPLRIPILDRYKGDNGLTAIGKVEAGVIEIGNSVQVLPTGHIGIVSHICIDDTDVDTAGAGENVLVSFGSKSKMNYDSIFSGSVISSIEDPCPVVTKFQAQLYVCEPPSTSILTAGYTAMLHVHNCAVECEVTALLHAIHKKNGRLSKRPPAVLRLKDLAVAEITLRGNPIPLETYQDVGQLGRFALRDKEKTVVIGKVSKLCFD